MKLETQMEPVEDVCHILDLRTVTPNVLLIDVLETKSSHLLAPVLTAEKIKNHQKMVKIA